MENSRRRNEQNQDPSHKRDMNSQSPNAMPQGLEGMNFEEQRGSYKNSDYGGAIRNTRSGRNSSDVKQEEL